MVGDLLRLHQSHRGTNGIVMISYPLELFGWRWHEGIEWLDKTLRQLHVTPDVSLNRLTDAITLYPPTEKIDLYESSWGAGGRHFNWNNADNSWMWDVIETCSARMEALALRYDTPTDDEAATLIGFEWHMLGLLRQNKFTIRHPQSKGRCVSIREWYAEQDEDEQDED